MTQRLPIGYRQIGTLGSNATNRLIVVDLHLTVQHHHRANNLDGMYSDGSTSCLWGHFCGVWLPFS
jgi:hypothetical protein